MFQLVDQAIMHVNLPSANVTVMQLDVWAGTNSNGGTNIIPISYVKKNYGKEWQPLTQPLVNVNVIKANKSDFRCAIILSVIDAQKSFLDDPHLNDQTTGSTVILGFK